MLRDPKLYEQGEEALPNWPRRITDRNYRLFAERGEIHVLNGSVYLRGTDPFELFEQLARGRPEARRVARLLPGLRVGQGGHGPDARQELHAGPGAALGLPDRAGGEPPRRVSGSSSGPRLIALPPDCPASVP